ncbi:SRPBCC family protein [Flavobacterium macacae]|uniref:Transcriptional regulator n=1 Tax=Flavobacterium macacae TaxID=2488993 RepID=A0A3P3WET7_9FLAO|nr:SRPBCC family protein [Flavobacterium macacae]RRJ92918.1 transcriptional regulator [Flavobacterium macacae]
MRILKYILLLFILAIIGLSVYVATQPSEYEVERSHVIKAQKSVVFSYVNDYRNWEDFGSWKDEDPNMEFTYPGVTIGQDATYSWSGIAGEGKMTTVFEKENDSIAQKVNFYGNEATAYLTFKDTTGGTKVTWHSKGKIGFMDKVYATFKGGISKIVGTMYEKSLAKLDKVISYEINTYDIKVENVVQKSGTIYFQHKVTCRIAEVQKNVSLVLQSMELFFKENGIKMTGSPFVLYDSYDVSGDKAVFSVCLPMQEEIFTADGSDYTSGKIESFQALKTTLKGDYSHSKEAWEKARTHIRKNNLGETLNGKRMEVYVVSANQVKSPSKWVTEIYVPVGNSGPVVSEIGGVEGSTDLVPASTSTASKPVGAVITKPANTVAKPVTPKPIVKPETKAEPTE